MPMRNRESTMAQTISSAPSSGPSQGSRVPTAARSRARIVLTAAAVLAVVFGIVWMESGKYEPLTVGKPASDFALPDLADTTVRLSDYRGRVVFLNFWATWCKPCQEE